ncbi:glucosyltransferase [Saccharopolyspora sp. HNM0983]|uniref:Glucosyltransferase n=1 Tax=Saccharopolyspora montiporae TaxID=2781240 RepID=A0A929FYP7_9PSEU|nr:glucosyltransferase [Saccharopolyspora sp. HNM0983]
MRWPQGRARVFWLSLGWVVLATLLQLMRGPGNRAAHVIWAEDGGVFFNQALRHDFWHNLFAPHAGYFQVVCRLLAQPAAHLPIEWVAVWFAISGALVVALISLLVFFTSRTILTSTWAPLLLAGLVPLLPQAGYEVNANISNLHWYLAYAAFWVLLAAPSSRRGRAGACFIVVLAALSDPLTALVLPAALVSPRRRASVIPAAAMVAALGLQATIYLGQADSYSNSATSVGDLFWIYGLRVGASAVTGDRSLIPFYTALGLAGVAAVGVLGCVALALLVIRAERGARRIAVAALLISVAYLVVPLGLRGTTSLLDREQFSINGSRYTLVPLLLLWACLVVLLDNVSTRTSSRRFPLSARTTGLVLTCLAGVQLLSDVGAPTVRSEATRWSAELQAAREECAAPPEDRAPQSAPLVADHDGSGSVPIVPGPDDVSIEVAPVPPPGEPVTFAIVLPCSTLRSS